MYVGGVTSTAEWADGQLPQEGSRHRDAKGESRSIISVDGVCRKSDIAIGSHLVRKRSGFIIHEGNRTVLGGTL